METFENNLANIIYIFGTLSLLLSFIGFGKDQENRTSYLIAAIIFFMLTCGVLYYNNIELKKTINLNQRNCEKEVLKKDSIIKSNDISYTKTNTELKTKHLKELKKLRIKIKDSSETVKNLLIAKLKKEHKKSTDSLRNLFKFKKDSLILLVNTYRNESIKKDVQIDSLKKQKERLYKTIETNKSNFLDVNFTINPYSVAYRENLKMERFLNYSSKKIKYLVVSYNFSRDLKHNEFVYISIINNYQSILPSYNLQNTSGKLSVSIGKRELQSGKLKVNIIRGNVIIAQSEISLI